MSMTRDEFYDTYNAINGMPASTLMGESHKPLNVSCDLAIPSVATPVIETQIPAYHNNLIRSEETDQMLPVRITAPTVGSEPLLEQLFDWLSKAKDETPSLREQLALITENPNEKIRLLQQGTCDLAAEEWERLATPLGFIAQCGLGLAAFLIAKACGLSNETAGFIGAGSFALSAMLLLMGPMLLTLCAGCIGIGRLLLMAGGASLAISVPYAVCQWFGLF